MLSAQCYEAHQLFIDEVRSFPNDESLRKNVVKARQKYRDMIRQLVEASKPICDRCKTQLLRDS